MFRRLEKRIIVDLFIFEVRKVMFKYYFFIVVVFKEGGLELLSNLDYDFLVIVSYFVYCILCNQSLCLFIVVIVYIIIDIYVYLYLVIVFSYSIFCMMLNLFLFLIRKQRGILVLILDWFVKKQL